MIMYRETTINSCQKEVNPVIFINEKLLIIIRKNSDVIMELKRTITKWKIDIGEGFSSTLFSINPLIKKENVYPNNLLLLTIFKTKISINAIKRIAITQSLEIISLSRACIGNFRFKINTKLAIK